MPQAGTGQVVVPGGVDGGGGAQKRGGNRPVQLGELRGRAVGAARGECPVKAGGAEKNRGGGGEEGEETGILFESGGMPGGGQAFADAFAAFRALGVAKASAKGWPDRKRTR